MTEEYTTTKCSGCGEEICDEGGGYRTACSCDPRCRDCGKHYVPGDDEERERGLCNDCLDARVDEFFKKMPNLNRALEHTFGYPDVIRTIELAIRRDLAREGE